MGATKKNYFTVWVNWFNKMALPMYRALMLKLKPILIDVLQTTQASSRVCVGARVALSAPPSL